ncbi:MAG: hypothetical protein QOD60_823 [Solirubrobacterales bacterium]|nr:hypothetical protein [Solirubrobacterales bacterium]
MRRGVRGFAAIGMSLIGLALIGPGPAMAGTLDQQQTDASGADTEIYATQSAAQTFTAGLSGGLDQVDLSLGTSASPTSYLSVEIRDVSGGPGSMILASRSVPASSVSGTPAFRSIKFSPPALVVTGTQYAIVVYSSTPPGNVYTWGGITGTYPGGEEFLNNGPSPPSGAWNPVAVLDHAFKTYVVPSPTATTGQRAAALKKCKKKKHSARARKKCRKKAQLLPV